MRRPRNASVFSLLDHISGRLPVGQTDSGTGSLEYDSLTRSLIFPNESKSMTNLGEVLEQLKEERSSLNKAIDVLSKLVKRGTGQSTKGRRIRRSMSAAARRKIAAAQRARWAKVKASAKKAA